MKALGLDAKVWISTLVLAAVLGLILFVPAGTVNYWQAWVYLCIYFGASIGIILYLMKSDPDLLARRMSGGPTAEKEGSQRIIMTILSCAFVAMLAVPALDRRYGWTNVPVSVVIAGDVFTALWFYLTYLVFRENTFTASVVQVTQNQSVISTGPYAYVRHPMYAAGLLFFIATPLALGSYWGLVVFVAALPALIWRLLDEERLLAKNLPGYRDYCAKVRWRLIPGVF